MYRIEYSPRAKKDVKFWAKNSKDTLRKIRILINEIAEHPRTGIGWHELLKNIKNGWSREINKKDRIEYKIFDDRIFVFIVSARGHHDDH